MTTTSPFVPTEPVVEVVGNRGASNTVIFPVVGFPEGSVTTCKFPDTNQFWLIAWSISADITSMVRLCGLPSVKMGTNGVRSRK